MSGFEGEVRPHVGASVVITDAEGNEWTVTALSGVESEGHAFPIVWVNRPLAAGGFDPMPWPADAVRAIEAVERV